LLGQDRFMTFPKSYRCKIFCVFASHSTIYPSDAADARSSFTTSDGELFIYDNFVPKDHEPLLQKPLQAAPIYRCKIFCVFASHSTIYPSDAADARRDPFGAQLKAVIKISCSDTTLEMS
jgi:hypothetical protein